MSGAPTEPLPSRREVFRIAWPIVLANAASPLLGLADTAVIGHAGSVVALGAIALGTLVFDFIYWSFGFLRMGTTGFVAQADGACDEPEVRAAVFRALMLALAIGLSLVLLQVPLAWLSGALLKASPEVERVMLDYVYLRIWAAPASLSIFAMMGAFVGLGESRHLLRVQLFLNVLNIALDLLLAGVLGLGALGVALGTLIAAWSSALLSLALVLSVLRRRHRDAAPFFSFAQVKEVEALKRTLSANADIMVRTLLLLLGFAWFAQQGARFGDTYLAANHVLLHLVSFSAFFLDGFAFAAESLVGAAVGAGSRAAFDAATRRSSELALVTACGLALSIAIFGDRLVALLTKFDAVQEIASRQVAFASVYVLVAVAAFQLDGIFIGATRTRAMRNAALLSMAAFLALGYPLVARFGNTGLWIAFIGFAAARGATLGWVYPSLRAAVGK